jgi:L-ascorbate metabolism protein UlaG (beta-lactamase superfamily)
VISTSAGDLRITFIGHGTLLFTFNKRVIHIDPYSSLSDYSKLQKADIILITHEHRDHFNPQVIRMLSTGSTVVVLTETCAQSMPDGKVMKNGDSRTVRGIEVRIRKKQVTGSWQEGSARAEIP